MLTRNHLTMGDHINFSACQHADVNRWETEKRKMLPAQACIFYICFNPSSHWAGGRVHPWQVTSPSQGQNRYNQPCMLPLTPGVYSESPIDLTFMFWTLERNHADTRRTFKHWGAPPGIRTYLLWGNSTYHHITVQQKCRTPWVKTTYSDSDSSTAAV